MKSDEGPDNELIHAARNGDDDARATLGRWMFEELYKFFLSCFERDKAAELVQETVKDILANLERFDTSRAEPFRGWMMGFAAIEVRTQARIPVREDARRAKLGLLVSSSQIGPLSAMLEKRLRELIRRCINQLPTIHRQVLLHDLGSGDDDELAEQLGIAATTVRTRRHRAHELLRPLLEIALLAHDSSLVPSPT